MLTNKFARPLFASAFVVLLTALANLPAFASDTAKEKRWADQIVDGIFDGVPVYLEARGHKFLTIFTEAQKGKPRGGVILLHGIGVHPDWPQVINPLRTRLPYHGWATLSLQMPILPNEAGAKDYVPLFPEVAPRIQAGIKYLQARGISPIVLVAHSMGARMGSYFLATHPGAPVKAFVGIGMGSGFADAALDNPASLQKIHVPVLDLYGSEDLKSVLDSVTARANAAKRAGAKDYTQIKVEGSGHFFDGYEDKLVSIVNEWLDAHAAP
jgi:pimeloyl-ACP methyl ester carboxylesterase